MLSVHASEQRTTCGQVGEGVGRAHGKWIRIGGLCMLEPDPRGGARGGACMRASKGASKPRMPMRVAFTDGLAFLLPILFRLRVI